TTGDASRDAAREVAARRRAPRRAQVGEAVLAGGGREGQCAIDATSAGAAARWPADPEPSCAGAGPRSRSGVPWRFAALEGARRGPPRGLAGSPPWTATPAPGYILRIEEAGPMTR